MGAVMSFSKIAKKVSVAGAFGVLGLLGSDSAQAAPSFQGDTASLAVTITVDANCTVGSSGALSFGSYDFAAAPASGFGASATASVTVNCSDGVDWEVHVDNGLNGGNMIGTTAAAGLSPGNVGDLLAYSISNVSAGGAAVATFSGTGTAAVQSTTLYGTVASNLAPRDGDYSDTVGLELWY